MAELLKCFPELKMQQELNLYDQVVAEPAKDPTKQEVIEEKVVSYLKFTSYKINDDLDPYEVSKVQFPY